MQIDWTTLVLEIINFLVLVWILKRFLYRPVMEAIAARQQRVEGKLAEARAIGTYEVSIERHEDCCGYLLPPHPATRSTAAELEAAEAALPVAELVDAALAGAERENLTAPASEP